MEKIIEQSIEALAHKSFINYAHEVIEDRALADVRDGLKPVQRRILYTMWEEGYTPDKPYKKCAATIGATMGYYHPHGDMSIYNALTKLTQPFLKRYPLIDGYGNFGTIDDEAAAPRYTEAKLHKFGTLLLSNILKNTIEWNSNYDESRLEPSVLPGIFPNFLVNGTSGIAVGIASEIPPHNLGEVIDGICATIDNPNISITALLSYIKGPDFPTGGLIEKKNLQKMYEEGSGTISIKSNAVIENLPDGKSQIVFTDIPYQTKKEGILRKIALLAENLSRITDIRDESDMSGIRIVVELDKGSDIKEILDTLYIKTDLKTNYGVMMNALVNGKPVMLTLKGMIDEYIAHKTDVIKPKLTQKEHILYGLIKAMDILDDVIAVIRKSKAPRDAKSNLIAKFGFTEAQAEAICERKLESLTSLEIDQLLDRQKEIQREIKSLSAIIKTEQTIKAELKRQLIEMKERYADKRKTKIVESFDTHEFKISVDEFTLAIKENGRTKKLAKNYNGKEEVFLKTDSTRQILLFYKNGTVDKIYGNDIPANVGPGVLFAMNAEKSNDDLIFITSDGMIKKSPVKEYVDITKAVPALKLLPKAEVILVVPGNTGKQIIMINQYNHIIRFAHDDISPIGRIGQGVRGMQIEDNARIVQAHILNENDVFLFNNKAFNVSGIKLQARGGKGQKLS